MISPSEKYIKFLTDNHPDITTMVPVPIEVSFWKITLIFFIFDVQRYDVYKSPYTACEEDEKFVASVKARVHQLIGGDLHLLYLLHLLALFSPVDNDHLLEARELVDLLKHFQQKISIMIYTNLLSR